LYLSDRSDDRNISAANGVIQSFAALTVFLASEDETVLKTVPPWRDEILSVERY